MSSTFLFFLLSSLIFNIYVKCLYYDSQSILVVDNNRLFVVLNLFVIIVAQPKLWRTG